MPQLMHGTQGVCSLDNVKSQLVDVQHIYSHNTAFTAKKADGGMVTWGEGASTQVNEQIAVDVQHIYSNDKAFAAAKADGSVVAWGDANKTRWRHTVCDSN